MNKLGVFKALSDPMRYEIVMLISQKDMCAKGLANNLNISEAAVSQHIKILKEFNLICSSKRGYHVFYKLNKEEFNETIKFIENLRDSELKEHLTVKQKDCRSICKYKKCFNNKLIKEESIMKICFPVKSNEGVKSVPYGHFGSAPLFLIFDVDSTDVKVVNNGDMNHEHGKCQPIKALMGEVVDAVIVNGIGQGAISKLNSMGIRVYMAKEGDVEANLEGFKKGELKEFPANHRCSHDGCSH